MELTKKALEDVKFRTRGRWYDGRQVDEFLDKLAVAADQAERDWQKAQNTLFALKEQAEDLREENVRLQKLTEELKNTPPPSAKSPLRDLADLEREKNRLLQDIKALRKFREAFREAVEKDAGELAEKAKALDSDKLLQAGKGGKP